MTLPTRRLTTDELALDLKELARNLEDEGASTRSLKQLRVAMDALGAATDLAATLGALEQLARWIRTGPRLGARGPQREPPPAARFRLLMGCLSKVPEWRELLGAALRRVLAETSPLRLFSEVGLPNPRGLGAETADRLARRLLPVAEDRGDLGELLARLLPTVADAVWMESLDPALLAQLNDHLGDGWAPLREHMRDAVSLLATRVSALGLVEDIRNRSPAGPLRESPLFRLPSASLAELPAVVAQCREVIQHAQLSLESKGVSTDVVYRLDAMEQYLNRIEAMAALLAPDASREETATRAGALVAALTRSRARDRSLRDVLRSNTRLLALKIIDHAGETGEHYITTTRGEYFRMLASAAGGGFLTLGTCALKFLTKWAHLAPFLDGLASSLNYAGSFVVMQLMGFTLATKQPSMTAAAIARSIHLAGPGRSEHDLGDMVAMVARITRSQLAAAIGNVGMVIPTAIAFNAFYSGLHGKPFLDADAARYVVGSFHPTHSGTLLFAALTGVLLWASSLGAGWLENWSVYRRLPEAIEQHRARRWIGARTTAWLARSFRRNVSGFGGNLTLGFLLGMTPVLGAFFGLGLDVRHVTLSAGSLALAVCTLGPDALGTPEGLAAAVGILAIGALNFGVSFALALAVALRAKEVGWRERVRLLWAVAKRLARAPWEFVFPPKG